MQSLPFTSGRIVDDIIYDKAVASEIGNRDGRSKG
jgi:hypothetical protein